MSADCCSDADQQVELSTHISLSATWDCGWLSRLIGEIYEVYLLGMILDVYKVWGKTQLLFRGFRLT